MFLPLDETVGPTAYDISGCGNHGTHSDGIISGLLPLIPGGVTGTRITNTKYVDCSLVNNYYGQEQVVSFANAGFSDNDFSMEIWIYPNFNTAENLVFGDQVNDIGISWQKGNIIFKLQEEVLEYTVPYYKKALHIVAVYTVNYMELYVDGQIVATKELNKFRFTNTYLNLSVGPTANSSSTFIADAPAVYRYALSQNQIKRHYDLAQLQISPIQIVNPDGGIFYPLSDENTKEIYQFSYPANRSFDSIIQDGISYDRITNSLYLTPTDTAEAAEVTLIEQIGVPLQDDIVRTKIRWFGDNGIEISTSLDGETYEVCENGNSIPQYEADVSDGTGELYIKIVFSSSDASRYNPELYSMWLSFYDTSKIYAINYGTNIEPDSASAIIPGDINYPVLSRDYRNGLRVKNDNSFFMESDVVYRSIEFFYTPASLLESGLIVVENDTEDIVEYRWSDSGTIASDGLESIYVNGIDKSLETSISNVFKAGEIHHVVVNIPTYEIGSRIKFNSGYTSSPISTTESLYKNLAMYETQLTEAQIEEHYSLYTSRPSVSVDDNDMTVTESGVSQNTNDWIVIQNV